MKKFRYELIPSKKDYPEYIYDKTDLESITIPRVFHDTYTEKIISDWYENSERTIMVGEDIELDVELKIRKQSIEIAITPTGSIDKELAEEPREPELTTIWVGGVRRELKGKETAKYQIEYNVEPIKVRIEKEFYEPAEFTIEIPSEEDEYAYKIERKTGEWRNKSREETIKFEKKTEEDKSLRDEESFVKVKGINGTKLFEWTEEYIDNKPTGAKTKESSKIAKEPVTEIYVKGTMVVGWEKEEYKTEDIAFDKKTVEDKMVLPADSGVTTKGQKGIKTYYREYEYENGEKTGEWRNETSEVTKEPVTEIYTKGIMVVEWKRELYKTEPISFDTETIEDSSIPESQSYVKTEGVAGTVTIYREFEYVNGKKSDQWRNEEKKRTKEPVTEVKVLGTAKVEWKKELYTTNVLPFKTTEEKDKTILPKDSYVKTKGVDGEEEVYREYEWFNGEKTGAWRNETVKRIKDLINEVKVVGTMVLEWRKQSRIETIPITTRYEDDPNLAKGQTRTVAGTSGVRLHEWEEEFKNEASTGRKRNETSRVIREMVQKVVYEGIKESGYRKLLYKNSSFFAGRGGNPHIYVLKSRIEVPYRDLIGKNRTVLFKDEEFTVDITSFDEATSSVDFYFEGESLVEFIDKENLWFSTDTISIYE